MDCDVKHLDDVVVDPNTAVAAGHRVFNNPLDIGVEHHIFLIYFFDSITLKYILNYVLDIDVLYRIFIVAFLAPQVL